MRPCLDELAIVIGKKLEGPFQIFSVKFVGNTDQWIDRLETLDNGSQRYFRIAEGYGKSVTFVSPRMPFNAAVFTRSQDPNSDRRTNRAVARMVMETLHDQNVRDNTQLEFQYTLDRLFEGRDG